MLLEISELESPLLQINEQLLKGKNNKAKKALNRFLNENPLNQQAWLLLGITNRRIGSLDEAILCFEKASHLNTKSLEAWGLLTITYLDKGNQKLARETIERAGKLNPNDEKIQFYRNNLIRVYEKFGPFF